MTDAVINPPPWIKRQLRSSIWKLDWLTASQSSTLAQPKLVQSCEWMWLWQCEDIKLEFSQVHLKDPTWRLDGAMAARHHGDNFDHGWWKGCKSSCWEMANMFSLGNPENEALIAYPWWRKQMKGAWQTICDVCILLFLLLSFGDFSGSFLLQ